MPNSPRPTLKYASVGWARRFVTESGKSKGRVYTPAEYGEYKGIIDSADSWTAAEKKHGYDYALLGRHPTREDLDKVSTTVPVMATHISGHFAAVNSVGLKKIGYDASTPNPEGGVIRREADGRTPNGVLE